MRQLGRLARGFTIRSILEMKFKEPRSFPENEMWRPIIYQYKAIFYKQEVRRYRLRGAQFALRRHGIGPNARIVL
jgi:hypothetical protein